ncbi:MAG: pyridoxamine 5-phosphate oxidase [Mycobacterium sp.]|jgi:pyridoxamine 5'-phosphate oxidase|nr:pyridoxamine 5-phosphate oxidase [Mycobacterium sp.]
MNTDLRSTLRALPVLSGTAPEFDPAQCPDDPTALFAEWFRAAIQACVAEPHAMTLSTVGADGHPDARVLILKDVDDAGWHFAVSSASKKGADLSSNPVAALTFYWPQLVRQVRLRGAVIADPPDVTAADFLARSDGARALVLTRRQSQPLSATTNLDDALAVTRAELDADPGLVPDEWVSYAVRPEQVEFWQGDPERRHQRLLYTEAGAGWERNLLWP